MKTEHQEQVALIQWADSMSGEYPALKMLFAIPNGGLRNVVVAKKLKAEGVRAGAPDLFLAKSKIWINPKFQNKINIPTYLEKGETLFKQYHGLFIEMKSAKGKTTVSQEWWIKELRRQGYRVEVCHSFEEARQVICDYLGIEEG